MPEPDAQADAPILNVVGDLVALGPLDRSLVPLFQRWINDFEATRTIARGLRPLTREAEVAWYERATGDDSRDVQFVIFERRAARPIGLTGLHDVDHQHGTAE